MPPRRRQPAERRTSQREALREAFEAADRPMGPREALAAASPRAPRLGIATVYRTIKTLLQAGWLKTVELPGEPARYELSRKRHHHHFHCRHCGRVFDVAGCPGNLKSLSPPGFEVDDHEVVLYGRCDACVKTRGKPRR